MLRRFVGAGIVLFLIAGVALSKEYTGTLVKIDQDGNTIKLKVDDKDVTLKLTPETQYGSTRKGTFTALKKGAKAAVEKLNTAAAEKDSKVTIKVVTEGEGEKETVKEVHLPRRKKGE